MGRLKGKTLYSILKGSLSLNCLTAWSWRGWLTVSVTFPKQTIQQANFMKMIGWMQQVQNCEWFQGEIVWACPHLVHLTHSAYSFWFWALHFGTFDFKYASSTHQRLVQKLKSILVQNSQISSSLFQKLLLFFQIIFTHLLSLFNTLVQYWCLGGQCDSHYFLTP